MPKNNSTKNEGLQKRINLPVEPQPKKNAQPPNIIKKKKPRPNAKKKQQAFT